MKAQIVSFNCVLKNQFGKVLSSTFNNEVITHVAGPVRFLRALAEGLQGLTAGEKRRISVRAEEAYGYYDPKKVFVCAREECSREGSLHEGDQVVLQKAGGERLRTRVVEVRDDQVTLDANHPFAGQDLIFEIEATLVRDATLDEINQQLMSEKSFEVFH